MAREETLKFSLIDAVSAGFGKIADGVGKIRTTFTELNQAAELASKGIGLVRDVAAGIGNAVGGAADLETALSRVADITRATAAEQEALRAAVDSAVYDVGASAQDASTALVMMAEDGFSASEAVGSLNAVLSFAKANAQDAATATGALGGVLDTFGEKPQIIGQLADQLTAVARGAGTNTKALLEGLSGVGVAAEQAGISLNDTIGYLGILASRGIEGGAAVGKFNKIIRELADPARKAGQEIQALGLDASDFAGVLNRLSTDSVAAEKVLSALGKNPREALRILLEDGGGALNEFRGIVNGAAGDSERAADVIDKTFNGALTKLINTVDQARNSFLKPLLTPLADEFDKLSGKVSEFAKSEHFARLSQQVTGFVTSAVAKLGEFVGAVDFDALAKTVADFGDRLGQSFRALEFIITATAKTIRGIAEAIESVQKRANQFAAWAGTAELYLGGLRNVADQTGKSLNKLGPEFEKGTKGARGLGKAAADAAPKAIDLAAAVDETGKAAGDAADDLARMPEAAKLSIGNLAESADTAGLSITQLEQRLKDVLESLEAAPVGSPEFVRLAQDAAKLELELSKAKDKIKEVGDEVKGTGDKANNAANNLRNFAAAAGDAGDAADDLKSSNSQVSDSFGNIGQQAAAASVDLGNMSQALIDSALAMQAQTRSGLEIIKVWEGVTRQYNEANARIQQAIDLTERRIAATSEEARVRRHLEAQYGTDSTLLEKLVQLRLQENREREKSIELADREATERANAARAGQLGGFGAQQAAAAETPSGTRGRGTAGGEGARGPAQIVINVQGMTTDQARQFVEQSVVPELERINRLSR